MMVRTNINTSHLVRLAIIGFFCFGFAMACLYDGLVRYPAQRDRDILFKEYTEEHEFDLDPKEIADNWKELAAEKGWPITLPNLKKPRTDEDIFQQFLWAGVIAPIGLFFLIQLLLNRGRWIEANDMTLTSSQGHQLELSQIVELDKKKWQKKGIATIKYESDGRKQKLVIDDCNYERETTNKLLRHIESNIDHAIITGGKPEPPLKKAADKGESERVS